MSSYLARSSNYITSRSYDDNPICRTGRKASHTALLMSVALHMCIWELISVERRRRT